MRRTCQGDGAVDEALAAAQGVIEELLDRQGEVQATGKHWDDLRSMRHYEMWKHYQSTRESHSVGLMVSKEHCGLQRGC